MIKWEATFKKQLQVMRDEELLAAFRAREERPGDPVYEAYRDEIKRRALDR